MGNVYQRQIIVIHNLLSVYCMYLQIDLHIRLRNITNEVFVYRHMHMALSNYEYHFPFLSFFNLFFYTYVIFYSTDTLHFTDGQKKKTLKFETESLI